LELAAIVMALKIWRHYLIGCTFELKMDHKSLQYILTQRDLKARQRCWSELINEYVFGILYIKGKENRDAYALRRRPTIHSLTPLKVDLRDRVLSHVL
jgi:hypothetical protein